MFRGYPESGRPTILKARQFRPNTHQRDGMARTFQRPMELQPKGACGNVTPIHDNCTCHNCRIPALAIIRTRARNSTWGMGKSSFRMKSVPLDTLSRGGDHVPEYK